MQMFAFKDLLRDMKQKGKVQEQFTFEYNHVKFDVIFSIGCEPYELLIGAIGSRDFACILTMARGFQVSGMPDEKYYELCDLLNLNFKNGGFTSNIFLHYLSQNIPHCCSAQRVQPHQVARFKVAQLKQIDDDLRIYFLGWNNHTKDLRTARNIQKTRLLLGDAVASHCEKNNISSRWTDTPEEATDYYDPWEKPMA